MDNSSAANTGFLWADGASWQAVACDFFENRLLVEPLAWAPAYQVWHERSETTRELADLAKDKQNLLNEIAETYEHLDRSQKSVVPQ